MTTLNTEEFLEIFPSFRKGSKKLIETILSSSRNAIARANTVMQLEGQFCEDLELVVSGEKRVYSSDTRGREITLYEVGPGEACILNAVCVLANMPCPVNAMAITEVRSLLIPAKEFRDLVSAYEEMRNFVFGAIGRRFTSIVELLGAMAFERMDKRLFDYLVEKSENGGLALTHQQIANDLGTAREVVSRLLKDFEGKGKVVLSRGHIQLTELRCED